MLNEPTMDKLRDMRLRGMLAAFEEQLTQPGLYADLDFAERFAHVVDKEWLVRQDNQLRRRLTTARLKDKTACIEDVDYRHARGLDRKVFKSLASCDWVRRRQNCIITGPTGCGKTFLGCALSDRTCREGFTVQYIRVPRLPHALSAARADGTYIKLLDKLARVQLLMLDDWGIAPLSDLDRRDILEVFDDRHGNVSTLITSQLPVTEWHDYLADPTLADAILDRVVHNAHRLELHAKGGSMRERMKPGRS